jgi:HEAT repeat protein
LKFCAVDRLSQFDKEDAFKALKIGMAATADDFERANDSVKPALVSNIRLAAAQGLARSPHRDAKSFLMTFWNDSDASVRLDVLHAAARMHTPESQQLLKKMSGDQNEMVRSEALRYLKERAQAENGK